LDRVLTSVVAQGVRGVSAAVVFADGTRWAGVAGVADAQTHLRVATDTPFAVASVTKTFVAALAMQLVEERELTLDVPVARWLPQIPGGDRITLRELLGHTSGLGDTGPQPGAWTPSKVLGAMDARECDPGGCFRYSDNNYVAAAALIEAATGRSVAALVRERFLERLHLTHTWFQNAERSRARVATAYDGRRTLRDANGDVPSTEFVRRVGYAGALASTGGDLATWGNALFGGKVVRPESLAAMLDFERTATLPCPLVDRCPSGYGLGIELDFENGWLTWGHSGSTGALLSYFPEQRITIAVLTNGAPGASPGPYAAMQSLAGSIPGMTGETDVFAVAHDGARRRRVTTLRGPEIAPAVSPDGTRLAFSSDGGNLAAGHEIVVSDLRGAHRRVLTHNDVNDGRPAWAPDGERLVFSSDRSGAREIFVMRADGGEPEQLTTDAGSGANTAPSFSPDGSLIAFEHLDFDNFEIRVMRPDGTNVRTVVRETGPGEHPGDPSWAQDGRRLAFTGYEGPDPDIQIVNVDGSGLRTVTHGHAAEARAVWASDGTLAFVRDGDLWTMNPDLDMPPRRITETNVEEYFPAWSPDGGTLYFVASKASSS
jgi:D-alanyl-D-alanine carboxypeptidase